MTTYYQSVKFSDINFVTRLSATDTPNTFVAVLSWDVVVQKTGAKVRHGPMGSTITLTPDGQISKFAYIGDNNTRKLLPLIRNIYHEVREV